MSKIFAQYEEIHIKDLIMELILAVKDIKKQVNETNKRLRIMKNNI